MKKYFQLFSIALVGIAIPLLAMDLNRSLGDLASRFNDLAARLGGKVGGGEGATVYKPKNPGIAVAVIDVQPTFMEGILEKDELPVKGANKQYGDAVARMGDLMGTTVVSQDWHPITKNDARGKPVGHVSWATGFALKIPKSGGLLGPIKKKALNPYRIMVDELVEKGNTPGGVEGWKLYRNGNPVDQYPVSVGELLGKVDGTVLKNNDGTVANNVELYSAGYCGGDKALPTDDKLLWPPHSIQGSLGAEIYNGVYKKERGDVIAQKGAQCEFDSFSVVKDDDGTYTPFMRILKDGKISDVIFYGIATDFCVVRSVLDTLRENLSTVPGVAMYLRGHIVVNLCRGVTWETSLAAFKLMQEAGAKLYYVNGLNDGWNPEERLKDMRQPKYALNVIECANPQDFENKVKAAAAVPLPKVLAPKAPKLPLHQWVELQKIENRAYATVEEALAAASAQGIEPSEADERLLISPLVIVSLEGTKTLSGLIGKYKLLRLRFTNYEELKSHIRKNITAAGDVANDLKNDLSQIGLTDKSLSSVGADELISGT